jgi:ATP-dependent DNA ligase
MIEYFYPPQPKRIWPSSSFFHSLSKNPLWDAEIKYNGWRLLIFTSNLKFYNRHGTIIDIKSDIFSPFFKKFPDTVFDAELLNFRTKDIKNNIIIFDCPFYKNKDLRSLPLSERRKRLESFEIAPNILTPDTANVFRIQQFSSDFTQLYNTIIKRNDPIEEGIVIKRKSSHYTSHVGRGIEIGDWIKVKKIDDSNKIS